MEIRNRIFFVTGGCSGLGLAVVDELIALGGLVCVFDRDQDEGKALETKHNDRLLFRRADVRSEPEVHSGLKNALETWPESTIGGLVHCAGVSAADKTVSSSGLAGSLEIFKTVIDINLTGSFNVSRLVASEIVQQKRSIDHTKTTQKATQDHGVIILTSSTSYQDGQVGQVGYAASKGGVASMVLPMARDLARFGIRVNAIAPSLFDTQMGKSISPAVRDNLLKTVEYPFRFGDPQEFSSLVMECIRNTYLNGTSVLFSHIQLALLSRQSYGS
ncbi:hypothetical protein PSTG_03874 [Puccinia striiformis f. sp. tritici PST-78]|uniref:Ketoreductase domain-containing protein n=1 Tax=Puccinia striiformis f. sp. tritici PST-78 TaxID=1165861 RepID=A0A0L0VV94_9BASI|nr:hypothetical protein PSTG_03874 [Puccinia striiformis f. sp. tritici PST-78]